MAQAIGRKAVVTAINETTFGTTPGGPSAEKLYVKSFGVGGNIAQIIDETLSGFRGLPASIEGNKDVQGSIAVNVAPQSIGKLIKHLLGMNATSYAVAKRSTSTITGVEIKYGKTSTPAGNGTLTFTASGTTLTWAPATDTAGAAVNISAGGDFTIISTGGHELYVRVTASLIPGGNQSDTIAVGAGTIYEHVFSPRGTEATSMTLECDLGSEITSAYRWLRFLGCRPVKGAFKFGSSGFCEANFDFRGATFSNDGGATLDASPDDYGHTAFSMFRASIEVDGATYADAQDVSLDIDNDADDSNFTIGGGGVRGSLPYGFLKVSGSVNALFTSATLLNKAIAGTAAALRIEVYNGTGAGSTGNEALVIRIPELKFEAKTPTVDGPKGVKVQLAFNAHRPDAAESKVEFSLRTPRAAATF